MNFKLFYFLPIFAVLLISGCTLDLGGGGTDTASDILLIKNFKTLPSSSIIDSDNLQIQAQIQNVGKKLIPLNRGGLSTIRFGDYCPNAWRKVTISSCDNPDKKIVLNGADVGCEFTGISSGETKIVEWTLVPNKVKPAFTCSNFNILLDYKYETTGSTPLTFINSKLLNDKINRGDTISVSNQPSTSEGPVKAYITISDQPIPTVPGSDPAYFQVKLVIDNVGSGSIKNNTVTIKSFSYPGLIKGTQNCFIKAGEKVKLFKDPDESRTCELQKPTDSDVSGEITPDPIVVSIEYEYSLEKKEQITINPSLT